MNIKLIPVEASDAEDLVQLRILAMRESLERIGRFDPQRARDRFLCCSYKAAVRLMSKVRSCEAKI